MNNLSLRTIALLMAALLCWSSFALAETVDLSEAAAEIIISDEMMIEPEEIFPEQAEGLDGMEEPASSEAEPAVEAEEQPDLPSESEAVVEAEEQPEPTSEPEAAVETEEQPETTSEPEAAVETEEQPETTSEPSEAPEETDAEPDAPAEILPEADLQPEDAGLAPVDEAAEVTERAAKPQPVETFEFSDQIGGVILTPGETYQIKVLAYPLDQPHDVRFRSNHPGLASVDENGLITAVTGGTTWIQIYDGAAADAYGAWTSFTVQVDSDKESFESSPYSGALAKYSGPGGHVVVPEGFEAIGDAFRMNDTIISITLPDTVKTIGNEAFYGCTNLETIRFSSNLEGIGSDAFVNCHKLGKVSFPNSLKSIGDSAFSCCQSFTFDSLPAGIESIGEHAFFNCKKLEKVVLPPKVTTIELGLFQACDLLSEVVLPEGVTAIENDAFYGCENLEKVNLPDGIRSIGMSAFQGTKVSFDRLPSALGSIGLSAFEDCRDLTNLELPEGVRSIDAYAFRNCENLETLNLPSSVSALGNSPFAGCSKLTLRVPKNSYAHAYCEENGLKYELDGEMIIFHIEDGVLLHYYGDGGEVAIPEGVVRIADGLFKENRDITGLVLPSTLKEIGKEAFYRCENLIIPAFPEGLEIIGEGAFYDCMGLGKLSIPSTVRKIGASAFEYCRGTINSIELLGGGEVGDQAFFCHRADSIEIHGNVKSIGAHAFTSIVDCNYEAILHEGVETIGEYAFGNMAKITLPASVTAIADNSFVVTYNTVVRVVAGSYAQQYCTEKGYRYTFHGGYDDEQAFIIRDGVLTQYVGTAENVVIPETVAIIGEEAFRGNEYIRTVRMNSGVTEIRENAFLRCSNLKSVTLPDSLVKLGNYVFAECTSLEKIVLPDSVTDMGIDSFRDCTSLKSAWIGANVAHFDGFRNCTSLESVNIPKGVESISEYALFNCASLKEIDLPDGINYIGFRAFYGCTGLTRVDIPASVTTLREEIFENCTALKHVNIPAKCYRLRAGIFKNCTSLVSVYIPSGVREINDEVFTGCTALKSVHVPGSVRAIDKNVFQNCPNLTVYCPSGSEAWDYCKENGVRCAKPGAVKNAMSFAGTGITIGVGQTSRPALKVNEDYALGSIRFFSSSAKVVAVNKSTGEIKGLKTGTATITAASESGAKATVKVTVRKAPGAVRFAEKKVVMGFGESILLQYALPEKTAADVRFSASDDSVLRVEQDGRITAVGAGKAAVTIATHNGKTDTCEVTVLTPPEQLYLDKSEITVRQTLTAQLSPYVNEGSLCRRYDFVSSNPAIVEVDEAGRLRGVSVGSAQITVAVPGVSGLQAVCAVTVIEPPAKVVLAAESVTLGVNEKFDLAPRFDTGDAGEFSFASSKTKYVEVSKTGVVTAKRAGSALVKVTAENGLTSICKVTVKKAPGSVKLNALQIRMGEGEQKQLSWTLSSKSAGSVSFASSDTAVAEVTESGVVIAKAAGTATIGVRTYNGKKATAKLTVCPAPQSIDFARAGEVLRFGAGETGVLTAKLSEGSFGSYTFASSDAGVLRVDAGSGRFSAVGKGECTVTVTAYNGISQSRDVVVCGKPAGLKFNESSITIGVGQQTSLSVQCWEEDGAPCGAGVSFKSSSAKRVAVNSNGDIKGLRTGSATITATTYNGRTAKIKVTVKKAPAQLKLNADALTLGCGETFQLQTKLSPSGCYGGVRYESSDPKAVTVSASGRVTANRSEGSATITATTYNGLTDSCTVHLGPEPTYIRFPEDSIELYVNMKYPMNLETDGKFTGYAAKSGNSKVAYVDNAGNIVAKRKGTAEIAVKTYNGKQANLRVTVKAAPGKYQITLPGKLEVGRTYNLLDYYASSPASDPHLTFGSASVNNDKARIVVNDDGVFLTVVKEGSFSLTVRSYNGKTVKKTFRAAAVQN